MHAKTINIVLWLHGIVAAIWLIPADGVQSASLACPVNAGPDTTTCGFEFQLQGSEMGGWWDIICSRSAGKVFFADQFSDTTEVKVERCGVYRFVYHVETGPCPGTDTVDIEFLDPSFALFDYELLIGLELDAPCHSGVPPVICENEIEIPGQDPPDLAWEFCGLMECFSTIYSTEPGDIVDSCIVDAMECDTAEFSDSGMSCITPGPVTGDNILDFIGQALDIPGACPIPDPCLEIPPECIDTIIDTTQIFVPILDGGLWHFLNDNSELVPLGDTSLIVVNGRTYAFIVQPGSDYYGPGNLKFIVWEVNINGDWVDLTSPVTITVQWVLNYVYDTVDIVDTSLIIKDSCNIVPCGGVTVNGANIDIPDAPIYPCLPLDLSFGVQGGSEFYQVYLNCFTPSDFVEVCPGQVEEFNYGGFFFYSCVNASGCPYDVNVEVFEEFQFPQADNITTWCDASNLTYNVSFDITGGNGQVDVQGFGVYNYGDQVTISGIPSCSDFQIELLDIFTGCPGSESVYHCCCTPSFSELEVFLCPGESIEFNGQILTDPGIYQEILSNIDGCDSTVTLELNELQQPEVNHAAVICDGDVYDFYGTLLTQPGVYTHTNAASTGCDTLVTLELQQASPDESFVSVIICAGQTYSFGSQILDQEGQYTDSLVNSAGCDSIVFLDLMVSSPSVSATPSASCFNEPSGSIKVNGQNGGSGSYQFSIDGSTFQSASEFKDLAAGQYSVTMRDANGCTASIEVTVDEIAPVSSDLEETYYACNNDPIIIDFASTNDTSEVSAEWTDGYNGLTRVITETGNYELTIRSVCEMVNASFSVEREESGLEGKIFVPNVFSPNGDGVNDEFRVTASVQLDYFELHLYDRWGDELRKFESIEETWDGSFLGQDMNPGVYVWWLKAAGEGCDGRFEETLMKGDVTIVK